MTLQSMKEWLESWGEGPNWSDASGATVPITKSSLRELIANQEKALNALRELRTQALDARDIPCSFAATMAAIAEGGLS